ncbi:MEDS domain-containing protein [Dactylosporangium sp. NPDC049140]|uniref:MEDS domain-containing protein n=1 Tax=Dactylosporangium sp. NPDC049140 TaxID=3155647 RepID=UPI0033EA7269
MRPEAADQHICWTYDDRRELRAYARSYLAAGIAAGERVWFAGPGDPGWLPAGAEFVSLDSTYAAGAAVDPHAQVAAYAAATEAALAAGHTGLRVFADCTALVRTGAGLDAFARYEALVDRYIAVAPMRAVCALYRPEAGDRAVGELACLHPATNAGDVRFALRGDPGSPGTALLSGELDGDAERLFPAALGRVQPQPENGQIVFDAHRLRFVDHRALLHLQRYAERHDATAVLRTPLTTATHLVELLRLSRIRVEAAR